MAGQAGAGQAVAARVKFAVQELNVSYRERLALRDVTMDITGNRITTA
jgi:ABC-type phosphate transport system ATPase subunit